MCIFIDSISLAPNRSFRIRAHILRIDLNLATSSRRFSPRAETRNSFFEATSSTGMPRSLAHSRYWMALAKAKAIPSTGRAPIPAMCSPEICRGDQLGRCLAQNSTASVVNCRDCLIGKICVPRPAYSFKMSFCVVP